MNTPVNTPMNTLFVLPSRGWSSSTAALQRLADQADGRLDVRFLPDGRMTAAHMDCAEVIFGFPDPAALLSAPQLQWLHLPSSGADPYVDLRLYANRQVTLTTSAGVYGAPMAEHILMLFLMLARGYRRDDPDEAYDTPRELNGSTVVLLGLGDVGRTLAARLSSFATTTLGIRRNLWDKPPHVHELLDLNSLKPALARADFVVSSLPLTRETQHLLNADAFNAMKPGAIFVNVGRGAVVDTDALTDALARGHLAGTGLDVTDPEPLPADHPLCTMPNVILTPHIAGASCEVPQRRFAFFEKQLARYLAGRRLHNVVDFFRGY
ncbi:MAG: D-2-hydroxyacid dehydrogenase [Oscillospiraceae bacterium]|nr:D-2-hydroxyacid dehydrogenase [Oscillospiraceae bacterium]